MSDVAIKIENLSKRYRYGGDARLSSNLRADIGDWARAMLHRGNRHHPPLRVGQENQIAADREYFWALRDINLEITQGEVVGIIGRNGAGKSTLLKILSRITPPTEGRIVYHGRVASLLEVGTGFHRELTGRENIFLNGSILGMKRSEIAKKFDEIVAFAEVEKFIDTPVKFYSSGMYVRLAFAVASHLEPEILIVDEVLAVGDASFQKKCLGKMSEVAHQGRTVLFVTHNMTAIQQLCSHCWLLNEGRIAFEGGPTQVILKYMEASRGRAQHAYRLNVDGRQADGQKAQLLEVDVLDSTGKPCDQIRFAEPFAFRMLWDHRTAIPGVAYAIRVSDDQERLLFAVNTLVTDLGLESSGLHNVVCRLDANVLLPGEYVVSVGCYIRPHTSVCVLDPCIKLVVVNVPFGSGRMLDVVGNPIFAVQPVWENY